MSARLLPMLSIVVAASENNVIGVDNRLPWRLPDDLRRFKALTIGKPVVMGRRTFESIGRALPDRLNIVVSRQRRLAPPGVLVVDSIEAAVRAAQRERPGLEIMLIGGGQIYSEAWPRVDTVYMTRVHAVLPGDAYFPTLPPDEWRLTESESRPADERHEYAFTFQTFERIPQ